MSKAAYGSSTIAAQVRGWWQMNEKTNPEFDDIGTSFVRLGLYELECKMMIKFQFSNVEESALKSLVSVEVSNHSSRLKVR